MAVFFFFFLLSVLSRGFFHLLSVLSSGFFHLLSVLSGGFFFRLRYVGCLLENEGCLFVATNTDSTFPSNRLLPGELNIIICTK